MAFEFASVNHTTIVRTYVLPHEAVCRASHRYSVNPDYHLHRCWVLLLYGDFKQGLVHEQLHGAFKRRLALEHMQLVCIDAAEKVDALGFDCRPEIISGFALTCEALIG